MSDVVARVGTHSSVYEDCTEFIHIGTTWRRGTVKEISYNDVSSCILDLNYNEYDSLSS